MQGGKCMAKQLDCTTTMTSTQNNGIHGIHFGPHMTFSRLSCVSQQRKTCIDQHLRHGLDNFKIESFQSVEAQQKLLSELDFGLGDDGWIEDDSHIFRTLYYTDILNCIQFLLAHLPFQGHLDVELLHLTHSEGRRFYSEMNLGDWWCDTRNQLPTGAMIAPVRCAFYKTHLTNFSGDQHAWLLHLRIVHIRKDIHHTHRKQAGILVGLSPCPQKSAKNTDEAWHSAFGTVMSLLRHRDITGPGLKWDCADGFHRQWYPLWAAKVKDYPEQVMVAQVSYGSSALCENPNGAPMLHWTFQPLDNSRDHKIYLELLVDNNIDTPHTLGVHPIHNQFW